MLRNELIEKLNETVSGLDDSSIQFLVNWADFMLNGPSVEEIREKVATNERALAEQERVAREQRRANLTRGEKVVFNRIQKGKALVLEDVQHRDMTGRDVEFLRDVSQEGLQLACDAFYLGFEKGYKVGSK